MGAVRVQVYNQQLMGMADYNNLKVLKMLYRNLTNMRSLAESGDSVATCIYIDLSTALESGVLTASQKLYITEHLLNSNTIAEIAMDYNKAESTICEHIDGGLKRIQKALREGNLYNKEESA
jgi:hypothetical protein